MIRRFLEGIVVNGTLFHQSENDIVNVIFRMERPTRIGTANYIFSDYGSS